MMNCRCVLLTSLTGAEREAVASLLHHPEIVRSADEVAAARGGDKILLSYSTATIVPARLLATFRSAYNIHAASPDFPGRDPHHWAIYYGATRYGATLHVMTEKVDAGPILDVEWFDIPKDTPPIELLSLADAAALRLLKRAAPKILAENPPVPLPGVTWGTRKTTRAQFLNMCRLHPDISREEFERRVFAFDGGTHENLTMELHGRLFRLQK